MNGEAGKGSAPRPVDGKLYRESFERIFGRNKRDSRPGISGRFAKSKRGCRRGNK
jgi:hypothetical protein